MSDARPPIEGRASHSPPQGPAGGEWEFSRLFGLSSRSFALPKLPKIKAGKLVPQTDYRSRSGGARLLHLLDGGPIYPHAVDVLHGTDLLSRARRRDNQKPRLLRPAQPLSRRPKSLRPLQHVP